MNHRENLKKNRANGIFSILCALCAATPALSSAEDLPARLDWGRRVELGLPVSGVVDKVAVEPGAQVKAGQPLLSLDLQPFRARLEAAQAAVKKLGALRAEADKELSRTQALYDQTLISNHELETARNAAISASAELAQAESEASQAKTELDYAQLRAPFAGLIVARHAEPGQAVVSRCQAQTLLVLADHRKLLARAEVPAARLAGLSVGQKAEVAVNGQRYPATVAFIGFEPLQRDGEPAYLLETVFEPPENSGLRAGLAATVGVENR